jgi:hypothetical protein
LRPAENRSSSRYDETLRRGRQHPGLPRSGHVAGKMADDPSIHVNRDSIRVVGVVRLRDKDDLELTIGIPTSNLTDVVLVKGLTDDVDVDHLTADPTERLSLRWRGPEKIQQLAHALPPTQTVQPESHDNRRAAPEIRR